MAINRWFFPLAFKPGGGSCGMMHLMNQRIFSHLFDTPKPPLIFGPDNIPEACPFSPESAASIPVWEFAPAVRFASVNRH
jgi:hypothetical protein